jgi:membrane-associated phospholipid phosphatase
VKEKRAGEENGEFADCRLQTADSKILLVELQTGNDVRRTNWQRWWFIFLFAAAVLLAMAFYVDNTAQHWITSHSNQSAKLFMRNVSRFGDWPEHLGLGLLLLAIAWWRGSKKWTRIFVSMLIAFALAGSIARVTKIATGRARPSVKTEIVWNGPQFSSRFNAFPSGHTAASTAFFGILFFVSLRLGLLCLPIPALIAFSRMYVAAHYLSDVVGGGIVGVFSAFLVAIFLLSQIANPKSKTDWPAKP